MPVVAILSLAVKGTLREQGESRESRRVLGEKGTGDRNNILCKARCYIFVMAWHLKSTSAHCAHAGGVSLAEPRLLIGRGEARGSRRLGSAKLPAYARYIFWGAWSDLTADSYM